MRERKYKVWDKVAEEWLVGAEALEIYCIDGKLQLFVGVEYANERNQNEFEIVEYTGLKGNKGKEIYTGDVLEFTYQYGFVDIHTPDSLQSETVIGEVYFKNGQYLVEGFSLQKAIDEFVENIGNKFDNPELLESEVEDG